MASGHHYGEELKTSEYANSIKPISDYFDFKLSIKTAGKIGRLVSLNHDIDFGLSEDLTEARASLL
jgi:hypothetical protein